MADKVVFALDCEVAFALSALAPLKVALADDCAFSFAAKAAAAPIAARIIAVDLDEPARGDDPENPDFANEALREAPAIGAAPENPARPKLPPKPREESETPDDEENE